MNTFKAELPPEAEALIKVACRQVALRSILYTLAPLALIGALTVVPAALGLVSTGAAAAVAGVTFLMVCRSLLALMLIEREMLNAPISDEEKAQLKAEPRAVTAQDLLLDTARLLGLMPPDMIYRPQNEDHVLQVFVPFSLRQPATVFLDKGFLDLALPTRLLRTAMAHELGHLKVRTGRWFSWYVPLVRRAFTTAVPLAVALLCVSLLAWGWLWMIPAIVLAFYGSRLLMGIYFARIAHVHEHGADAIADAVALALRAEEEGENSVAAVVQAMIKAVLKDDPELQLVREAPLNPSFKEWLLFNLMELLDDHPHPDERIARSLSRVSSNLRSPSTD